MTQAELHGIGARHGGQLVDERLQGEDVGVAAKRAERGGTDGRIRDVVLDDFHIGEVVQRNRVSVRAAGRLRHIRRGDQRTRRCQMPGGEEVHSCGGAGPSVVRLAPQFVRPGDHVPLRIDAARELHYHGRAVRLPREFVVAHPLELHRPRPGCPRDERGVEHHVVGAVVAVASGPLGVDAPDVLRTHVEHLGQLGAQREHALAVRPDDELAFLPPGDRARGSHRGVALVGAGIERFQRLRRRGGGDRRLLGHRLARDRQAHEMAIQRLVGGRQ